MAAIIGTSKVMSAAEESFISSTYWTDKIGPAASLCTIDKIMKLNVPEHLRSVGLKVQEGWKILAEKNNLNITVSGIYPMSHFNFNHDDPLSIKTLFVQLMLKKGFLATNAFYASYAHKKEDIDKYLSSVDEVFCNIAGALKKDEIKKQLKGPVAHAGFKRLT